MRSAVFWIFTPMWACSAVDPKIGFGDSGDTPDTLVDDTGEGDTDTGETLPPVDEDGDGYDNTVDCDDEDAAINPGALEVCDDLDNDCSGDIDDNATDALTWYNDADRDGFGDDDTVEFGCDLPPDVSLNGGDCDDNNALVFPGQIEICDGLDNDCDAGTSEAGTVSFYDTELGLFSDETALFASGTFSSPLEYTTNRAGTYTFCGGEWYVSLEIEAPTSLIGVGGASANILSGARDVRVIDVDDDLTVDGMTLTLGEAPSSSGQSYGGALYCNSGATIRMDDVVISSSEATQGAGLYLDDCPTEIYNSEISDNTAAYYGAALSIVDGDVYLENTLIQDNTSGYYGGGFYLTTTSSSDTINLTLMDTLVEDNASNYYGSALYAYPYNRSGGITVSCERTRTGTQGGFLDNEDGYSGSSGVIYLLAYYSSITFSSIGCDFGDEGAGDNNDPTDILLYASYPADEYNYDNGATFSCTSSGCK